MTTPTTSHHPARRLDRSDLAREIFTRSIAADADAGRVLHVFETIQTSNVTIELVKRSGIDNRFVVWAWIDTEESIEFVGLVLCSTEIEAYRALVDVIQELDLIKAD